MIKKPIAFFAAHRRRKIVFHLTSCAMIGVGACKLLPETLLIQNYIDVVHNYSNGKKVELSEKLEERFVNCIELAEVPPVQKNTLHAYSVFGFDIHRKGSTRSRYGAFVGIPVNYEYETADDIDKRNLLINNKRVDWKSPMGKKLEEALVLPERLQVFAMCREIISLRSWKSFFHAVLPSLTILCMYATTTTLNIRLNLFEKVPMLRYTMYFLVGTFSLGSYFLIKDFSEVYCEMKTDKELCKLGPEFIQNGVDFYDKEIRRNIALRHFMGKEGKKKYSALGNENFFLRYPKVPVVYRKQYFVEKLEKLKKGEIDKEEKKSFSFDLLNINILPPPRPKEG